LIRGYFRLKKLDPPREDLSEVIIITVENFDHGSIKSPNRGFLNICPVNLLQLEFKPGPVRCYSGDLTARLDGLSLL